MILCCNVLPALTWVVAIISGMVPVEGGALCAEIADKWLHGARVRPFVCLQGRRGPSVTWQSGNLKRVAEFELILNLKGRADLVPPNSPAGV